MKFYRLSDATLFDRINTMYQFIKPFLDKKKMSIFEDYGVFNLLVEFFFFFFVLFCFFYSACICRQFSKLSNENQGPVVQSVVSLTSLLRVISLTVLADSIHNILIFFAEKMWVAFALQKLLTFFQQKISAYLRITRCKI